MTFYTKPKNLLNFRKSLNLSNKGDKYLQELLKEKPKLIGHRNDGKSTTALVYILQECIEKNISVGRRSRYE